jgi:hypothetical protein
MAVRVARGPSCAEESALSASSESNLVALRGNSVQCRHAIHYRLRVVKERGTKSDRVECHKGTGWPSERHCSKEHVERAIDEI